MTATTRRQLIARLLPLSALAVAWVLLFPGHAGAAAPAWRVAAVSGPTNLPPLSSEIQEITVDATGGSFVLSFEGETTAPMPFDETPADLGLALEALPGIGAGGVEASGGPGGDSPYFVRFAGPLASADVPQLVADSSQLSGGAAVATVTTATAGGTPGEGTIAVYAENVGAATAGGTLLPTAVVDALPLGLTPTAASGGGWSCSVIAQLVTCSSAESVRPGQGLGTISISVRVKSAAAELPNQVTIAGGGAATPARYESPITVSATPATAGIQAFQAGAYDEDGNLDTRAGAHPFQASTAFFLNTIVAPSGKVVAAGDPREIEVDLPPGFVGNPLAAPRCPEEGQYGCGSEASQVGLVSLLIQRFAGDARGGQSIYDDTPAHGYPAEFAFNAIAITPRILGDLRSDGDYGVTVSSVNTPQYYNTYGAIVTLCSYGSAGGIATSTGCRAKSAPDANPVPLLTNPADCAEQAQTQPVTELRTNTWQESARFSSASVAVPAVTGCAALAGSFNPAFSFEPESHRAASPAAFSAKLELPQEGLLDPDGRAVPLKRAVVELPAGVDVNPSSATGLEACSEAQIGLITNEGAAPNRIRFDKSAPSCPEASRLGTVEAETPLLDDPVTGTIYLAAQDANPFGSLLALYLVLENPRYGILVKLPGKVEADPATGQLTATFDDNPQLPVSSLRLHFRGDGPRSPLATPDVCGAHTTIGEWTPWSAPESGPAATTQSSFSIDEGAAGGSCPSSAAARPFSPSFEAGTASTAAGAFSPLRIRISRTDGEQELRRLRFTLPPGLSGKLAGIPYCPEAAIAAAEGRSGKAELASPSCPAASQLGTVDSAAGIGSEPIHVGGHLYLAGPYKGAPVSAVVITPAVAGPFDLGNVVVRAPLLVDPATAQINAVSDPIPTTLRGIPLSLRSVSIDVDRSAFTLNPTSCEPMSLSASLEGDSGASAAPASHFQVGGCEGLGFSPKLRLSLRGGTRRAKFPALKAVLTQPGGQADVAYAQATLPHSAFLEQAHIGTICSRVEFAATPRACPAASVYGWARAWSPLLEAPIEGPVYLRSNGGERVLPDLVGALRGPASQPIEVDLVGYVDAVHARLRTTFALVPDAPVSRFVLEMRGGKKGLLVNSEDLCRASRQKRTASVRLVGHNNSRADQFPVVANGCRGAKHRHRSRGHR